MIVNSETLKQYVGQHKGDNLRKYLQTKLYSAERGVSTRSYLYASMRKHPKEAWSIHSLVSNLSTREECDYWEKFYIRLFHSQDASCGYNICDGGEGFTGIFSEESKAKMSESHLKQWAEMSDDVRHKRREKSAATQTGVPKPEGFGEKIRQALTDRTWTPEQREKIPAALQNPSPETRTRLSQKSKAAWARGAMNAAVEKRRGIPRPPEATAAMHSLEAQAKAAAWRRGRRLSPEHVAGISERKKLWWAQHPDYKLPASRNTKISAAMKGKAPVIALRTAHSPEAEAKRQATRLRNRLMNHK